MGEATAKEAATAAEGGGAAEAIGVAGTTVAKTSMATVCQKMAAGSAAAVEEAPSGKAATAAEGGGSSRDKQ